VVSAYSESLSSIRTSFGRITSIPAISALNPNIVVYTKHPTDDLSEIATSLDLPSVSQIFRLPNKGREGGTYLTHLLTNWNNLAEHTLFIQGDIHNREKFLHRLEDFFSPNSTGFLPLGFARKTCVLTDCVDDWGWRDRFHHLSSFYTSRYREIAPPLRMLLTYKGQFVVSARRVRGMGREVLEMLLGMLEDTERSFGKEDPQAWINGQVVEDDDKSNPKFGYTLERAWGLVFQCADGRIAEECPELGKRRRGEGDGACQCLD
jgi:hypothetical protein